MGIAYPLPDPVSTPYNRSELGGPGTAISGVRWWTDMWGTVMHIHRLLCTALLGSVFAPSHARAQGAMGDAQYIKIAESGAPANIASRAAITRLDAKGNATTVRTGTNGFTCVVGVPGDAEAPFCADQNGYTWIVSAASGQPKPTNSAPRIA